MILMYRYPFLIDVMTYSYAHSIPLSLTGLQIVAVDTSLDPSGNNVWYSDDISTVTSSSWILIGGALRSVAISVP